VQYKVTNCTRRNEDDNSLAVIQASRKPVSNKSATYCHHFPPTVIKFMKKYVPVMQVKIKSSEFKFKSEKRTRVQVQGLRPTTLLGGKKNGTRTLSLVEKN